MIPAYLLNASVIFFTETNPPGSFGQARKVLTQFATSRARADFTSETRRVRDGNFEQRERRFKVVVNQTPPLLTTKTWVQIESDFNGFTVLGQIDSIEYAGLGPNHSELTVIENPPMSTNTGQGGPMEIIRK